MRALMTLLTISLFVGGLASAGWGRPLPQEPVASSVSGAVLALLTAADKQASIGQFSQALKLAEDAVTLAREQGDRPGLARAYQGCAQMLESLTRAEEAITAWRAAAKVWEQAGNGPGQVEALARTAVLLMAKQPTEATTLLNRALELARNEKKHPTNAAIALSRVAVVFLALSQPDSAAPLMRATLDICRDHALSPRIEAMCWNISGNAARAIGDSAEAEAYFEQGAKIQERVQPGSLALAGTLGKLGDVAEDRGDFRSAEAYYRRCMDIRQKLEPDSAAVALSLQSLGGLAENRGDFRAALGCFQKCLQIQQKRSPGTIDVALTYSLLGALDQSCGDPAGAEGYYKLCLEIEERMEPGSMDLANSLRDLGNVAKGRRDFRSAEAYYRRCVDLQQNIAPTSISTAVSLGCLSDMESQRRDLGAAERHAQQAWNIARSQHYVLDYARLTFQQGHQVHLNRLMRCQLALQQTEAAFVTLEQGRAKALEQLLADHDLFTHAQHNPAYDRFLVAYSRHGRAVEDLDRARVECNVAQRAFDRNTAQRDSAGAATLCKALEAAKRQYATATSAETRTRVEVEDCYGELKQQTGSVSVPPLSIQEARESLPAGALFAAFAVGEQQSYLFLISTDAPMQALTLNITRKELEARVQTLRDSVTDAIRYTSDECARAGYKLFITLFPDEAQRALGKAKRLIVSPDGPLWEAPFAALVTQDPASSTVTAHTLKNAVNAQRPTPNTPPSWLGLQIPLTYANSLTLFAHSRAEHPTLAPGETPTALVVGDCIFARNTPTASLIAARRAEGEEEGRSYLFESDGPPKRLPATSEEARSIAQLYGVAPLLNEQATEKAVRSRLPDADIIHLATHGVLREEVPLASGVLLTMPKPSQAHPDLDDDGDLQTWEIAGLKLKAELVVLSACKTGLGAQITGEGVIGLTRALQAAGCRSVVTSQWSVEDASTSALMIAFHRGLRQGLAKDAALQQAMRSVADVPGGRTAPPRYWAAFFLTGDPDNPNLAARPDGL